MQRRRCGQWGRDVERRFVLGLLVLWYELWGWGCGIAAFGDVGDPLVTDPSRHGEIYREKECERIQSNKAGDACCSSNSITRCTCCCTCCGVSTNVVKG